MARHPHKIAAHHDHPEHHLHHDVKDGHHHNPHEHGAHHDAREHHGRGAEHDGARGAPHERDGNRGRSYAGLRERGDAAEMRPRLIPDYELLPRDDSGGPEWQPYTAEFGDGGYVTGEKAHLSVRGGRDDPLAGDEQDSRVEARNRGREPGAPSSSRRQARMED